MPGLLTGLIGLAALAGVAMRGVHWAFAWIYLPVAIVIPVEIVCQIAGVPDLTGRRAAGLGLVVGAMMTGTQHRLIPRWHWFDLLAFVPVLTLSVTYGLQTDFKGFYFRLADLTLDWVLPYVLTRGLLRDFGAVRAALPALALFTILVGGVAVYECRMVTHVVGHFWNQLGFEVDVPMHREFRRWGYLRAAGTFGGALTLGTFFAMVTPLMVLWGWLDRRLRWLPKLAVFAGICGCAASLSRGPILALSAALLIVFLFAVSRKRAVLLLIGVCVVSAPFLLDLGAERAQYVDGQMKLRGNVSSGYYRIALLQIYGKRVLDVGWWGDPEVVANLEYRQAWSIDNAYLHLFLTGGWLGGGSFCLIVAILLARGGRRLGRLQGLERRLLVPVFASFFAISVCLGNVWFARQIEPFFWIAAALLLNVTDPQLVCEPRAAGAKGVFPSMARPTDVQSTGGLGLIRR